MKKIKRRFRVVLLSSIAYAVALILDKLINLDSNTELIMFLAVYFLIGNDVIKSAANNIIKGQLFDEQFLMTIATVCAFLVGQYPEGVAVMLFYQIGELFQSYAVYNSRKSISQLMDIRPDYANLLKDGTLEKVQPEEVQIGDVIVIKPGEKVPLDGIVIQGSSTLDTKALTGESIPRDIETDHEILSGCINLTGNLSVKVTKPFTESTVSKILDLVENAGNKKAKTEKFITRFARYYTPAVVICAAALAIIPTLIFGMQEFSTWIYRAMIFLVVSCPCALVISIPLSFFGGLGGASRQGVLVKGSNYLETVAKIDTVVFDKTGTLTKGTFSVTKIELAKGADISEESLLKYAAYAEYYSNHPIAISLRKAYQKDIMESEISDVQEISGFGVHSKISGKNVLAGNAKLMNQYAIQFEQTVEVGTIIYVAIDEVYMGCIVISDEIKSDAIHAISLLKKYGISNIVMLTGDNREIAEKVANQLGITKVYSELLPQNKVEILEEILKLSHSGTAFVGDGMNDAPVLARADVGIAMGGMGSDAAIEAADIVIMTDEPAKIATVIKIAKKTINISKQNIVFALGVKLLVLILGALGLASMWLAVFADVGVSFIAILNSMRAMKKK